MIFDPMDTFRERRTKFDDYLMSEVLSKSTQTLFSKMFVYKFGLYELEDDGYSLNDIYNVANNYINGVLPDGTHISKIDGHIYKEEYEELSKAFLICLDYEYPKEENPEKWI